MALWDLICYKCGSRLKDIDVHGEPPLCECGEVYNKDYRTVRFTVINDIPPHFNESLGKWVKSRSHFRQLLWETNSRTDDITPTGGLTREERAIREGREPYKEQTVLEKRKSDPFWGMNPASPEEGLYADQCSEDSE